MSSSWPALSYEAWSETCDTLPLTPHALCEWNPELAGSAKDTPPPVH